MFGSKNEKYTLEKFNSMLSNRTHYKKLVQTFGERNTLYVTGMIFNKYKNRDNLIIVPKNNIPQHSNQMDDLLKFEYQQITNRKFEVSRLLSLAKQGRLRWKLENAKLPRREYFAPQPHLAGLSLHLEQAYRWITKSWVGPPVSGEKIRTVLIKYGMPPTSGCPLGIDYRIIRDIHRYIVSDAPAYRSPNFMTKYPSSVGGTYLLKWIFQISSNIHWPEQGDEKWIDYSLFFLGAIVTVQGFTDGNKRVGRTAYGVMILKSGVDFSAPKVALENELYNM